MSELDILGEDSSQEEVLSGYFREDIIPEDLPMLFPLLQAKASVEAFSALFSGPPASVLVRLMILREIGRRGDDPHWSPRDIESMFSYVDETKLKSAQLRLRNSGILVWLPDISRYQLSPLGRMALSALSIMMKFGHVTTDRMDCPVPRPGSLLEAVEFHAPVPSWIISRLDQTQRVEDAQAGAVLLAGQNWVSRKGYYKDSRGGRYIAVDAKSDFQFGKAAVLAEIEELAETIQQVQKELLKLENRKSELNGKIADCILLLEGWDADANLKARMDEFIQAANDLPVKESALEEAEAGLQEAEKAEGEAKKIFDAFNNASGQVVTQIKEKEKQADGTKDKITDRQKDVVTLIKLCRQAREKFAPHLRTPELLQSILAEYESLASAKAQSKTLQSDLDNREWEKDPQVLIIAQKLEKDYEDKKAVIDQRRAHHVRALTLTEQAREQYINVLYATLNNYIKNIRTLGEMAGVEIIATRPKLENDDLSLAQAGLDVEFRFDKKETDETSGGQKVIKSLVLLVGLMMDKDEQSGGFVFIDEPFAHLDVLNINLVSNFLRRSGAQYVLTTPNTHNINVFEASDLTFVTRSWKAPAKWAPPVAWARRQETGDEAVA